MAEVFIDTAGWANLIDTSQPYHALASALYRKARDQGRGFVTTNYVIAELIARLNRPLRVSKAQSVAFVEGLKSAPQIEIFTVSRELDEAGWMLFKNRLDKDWSLVDCVSFELMRERKMTEALTSDHHFEQAGYHRLLR